jgi:threonine dehydratase
MSAYEELVRRTPLVDLPGFRGVRLKMESLQRTGSFKIRGACRRLDALTPDEARRGVVTASAGNHGLGVAAAGRALGVGVEVVVPETTPDMKKSGIAALGAEILVAGANYQGAEDTAKRRAAERGVAFISPFDDPWVMLGNGGMLAEEILADAPATKRIVVPVGGGGMIAGIADIVTGLGVGVVGVQPAGNCAMHQSLALGWALTRYDGDPTIAEGCEGGVAESTFEICKQHGVTTTLVDEDSIRRAVARMFRLGFVVEPSAAVAVAGIFEGAVEAAAGTVVVVSGANIDAERLDEILRSH